MNIVQGGSEELRKQGPLTTQNSKLKPKNRNKPRSFKLLQ